MQIIYSMYHYEVALLSDVFQASIVLLKLNFTPVLQVMWASVPLSRIHLFNKYFLSNNCVPGCFRCLKYDKDQHKDPIYHGIYIITGGQTINNNYNKQIWNIL